MKLRTIFSKHWHYWVLAALLVFSLVTRLYRLDVPTRYYFDEVYHGVTAKLIVHNDARAYEWWNPAPEANTAVDWLHPPLAKLLQAGSMSIFGVNSFGWRFSSALAGTALVGAVYLLARTLHQKRSTALLAAGLMTLSGLSLTMSRIAMNDIHVTLFLVAAAGAYWRWTERPTVTWAITTAVFTGVAAATKWTGIFIIGGILLHQAGVLLTAYLRNHPISWRPRAILTLALGWLVPGIYLSSYTQMFWQGKTMAHFWQLHQQIWWYQTGLEATHPYQSTPLQWVLNLRPVYAYTNSTTNTLANIYLQGNTLLLWIGFIAVLAALFALIWHLVGLLKTVSDTLTSSESSLTSLRREFSQRVQALGQEHPMIFLLLIYGLMWMPWVFSPRILFFYHYLPAIPFLTIILAMVLEQIGASRPYGRLLVIAAVAAIAANFLVFFPNWTALPVSEETWAPIYFWLRSWR